MMTRTKRLAHAIERIIVAAHDLIAADKSLLSELNNAKTKKSVKKVTPRKVAGKRPS